MKTIPLPAAALLAVPLASPAFAQGGEMPELDAVKWYNTPPLTAEDLRTKAVFVEVFRTW